MSDQFFANEIDRDEKLYGPFPTEEEHWALFHGQGIAIERLLKVLDLLSRFDYLRAAFDEWLQIDMAHEPGICEDGRVVEHLNDYWGAALSPDPSLLHRLANNETKPEWLRLRARATDRQGISKGIVSQIEAIDRLCQWLADRRDMSTSELRLSATRGSVFEEQDDDALWRQLDLVGEDLRLLLGPGSLGAAMLIANISVKRIPSADEIDAFRLELAANIDGSLWRTVHTMIGLLTELSRRV